MYRTSSIVIGLIAIILALAAAYLFFSTPDAPEPLESNAEPLKLFYYNESKDKDASGNIACSAAGLEAVERELSRADTSIEDAIRLLLRGELTDEEKSRGISTEFPLRGVTLVSAEQSGSVLTLTFSDPQNSTSGGSCRVSILRAQIEATAKQYPGVETVEIKPDDVFQP